MAETAYSGNPPITVYRLQACPYCERVVQCLIEHKIDYNSRFVEALHSKRDIVKQECGVRSVPAIVDKNTGVTMAQSAAIIEYLETTYGKGE